MKCESKVNIIFEVGCLYAVAFGCAQTNTFMHNTIRFIFVPFVPFVYKCKTHPSSIIHYFFRYVRRATQRRQGNHQHISTIMRAQSNFGGQYKCGRIADDAGDVDGDDDDDDDDNDNNDGMMMYLS